MARFLRLTLATPLLAAACSGGPIDALAGFQGSWVGTQRIAGDAAEYPASYEVSRDRDALIWSFRSEWGGGFTGRGVQLWDASVGDYLETWTDSGSATPASMRGGWNAVTRTLSLRGEGLDWETGQPIQFQHRTVLHDADRWSYVMIAERAGGPEEVMWLEMRRK